MKPRLLFSAILCFMLAFGAAGCSVSVNRDSDESSTESSAIGSEEVKAEDTTTDEDEKKNRRSLLLSLSAWGKTSQMMISVSR